MTDPPLADSGFLVLALLAEGDTHGYDIVKLVDNRGFRLWTRLQRSTIYNTLTQLENDGLISVRVTAGEGADRKVYRITGAGTARLRAEGVRHLADPAHPRNEIDLGIYALPFLTKDEANHALAVCLDNLRVRREFLRERLAWCRENDLQLPGLAFERPLLALDAEIRWLERVTTELATATASPDDWARFSALTHQ